jgi:ABC-2 type transport system ATP-binding protein
MPTPPSSTACDEFVIDVVGLTKSFGGFTAVDDLSFSARSGQIFGLLGPNGAGKTTTIQLLLGLTTPTAGAIRILGLDMRTHRRAVLQRVNFSSAYISLPYNLSVWENMNIFGMLYGVPARAKKSMELLERLEIADCAKKITGSLSSGQLTRLNLCKALLNDPEILFLDEPTASLDPDIAGKVRAALLTIQSECRTTIIYTSHNMLEVEALCDEVIFLSRGKVAARGAPSDILHAARSDSLEDVFISIARDGELIPKVGGEAR